MEIRNRLFPYPVLCTDNDDYIDSFFSAECELREDYDAILLNFNISLENNEELKWLVREGMAEFVIHMECSSTSFRQIVRTSGSTVSSKIPKGKINNELSLLSMLVSTKEIHAFHSPHLNEDYVGEPLDFKRGSILAYCNMPKIFITKEYEELAGDNAFFTIIKRISTDGQQNPVTYDINDAKIKILVDESIYNEYIKFQSNPDMEALNLSLLVMPAIAYMIEILREEELDKYRPLYWYQKISRSCKLRGIDFEMDLIENGDRSGMEIAQQLLRLPINRAYVGLSRVIEE